MAFGWLSRLRRENSSAARREREDQLARALTQGLRTLSTLLTGLADRVEKERLERSGYHPQERYLERTDHKQS
jgi:hypothetical protein